MFELLDDYLREVNPYSNAYKQMYTVEKEQEMRLLRHGIPKRQISMYFKRETSDDPRRYNVPKVGEIAVIFDGENGEPNISDFVVQHKASTNEFKTSKLNILRQHCDPMVYPLLFFHGEPGLRIGIEHTTKKL